MTDPDPDIYVILTKSDLTTVYGPMPREEAKELYVDLRMTWVDADVRLGKQAPSRNEHWRPAGDSGPLATENPEPMGADIEVVDKDR